MNSTAQIIHFANKQSSAPLGGLLKAAGDDLRLHILRVLAQDSFSVSELCIIFNLRQSALSPLLATVQKPGVDQDLQVVTESALAQVKNHAQF